MADTVLVVDDEKEIADLVELALRPEGFRVLKCHSGAEALESLRAAPPDLAILDVMLPDADGFTLCREIRREHHYPVIFLSSKTDSADKLQGLALGGDDYVTKPFDPAELAARVKAQLRRFRQYNALGGREGKLLIYGGLCLDLGTRRCWREGRPLDLTPTEFSLLYALCRRRGDVAGAEELYRELWGASYYSRQSNPIAVHIRHLREKLGDSMEDPKIIKTVWGVGYKIEET